MGYLSGIRSELLLNSAFKQQIPARTSLCPFLNPN
jgi:hypothetical protein